MPSNLESDAADDHIATEQSPLLGHGNGNGNKKQVTPNGGVEDGEDHEQTPEEEEAPMAEPLDRRTLLVTMGSLYLSGFLAALGK